MKQKNDNEAILKRMRGVMPTPATSLENYPGLELPNGDAQIKEPPKPQRPQLRIVK